MTTNPVEHLTFRQTARMCFWGSKRRYEYFDYLHDGMDQRSAFRRALNLTKKELHGGNA